MSGQERDVEATGKALIAAERRRQVEVEGWTPEHDREHGGSQFHRAAKAYEFDRMDYWPWDRKWWKPKDALSNLIRAGALYQAAVDLGGYTGGAEAGVSRCAAKIDGILSSPVLAERDARIKAEAWDEGQRAGEHHERAKWYWQARNRAAMAAAGYPVERPERPANPYRADRIGGDQ